MADKINATEAARRLSDLVNRTRYRGESFIVVRNGEEVCRMLPPDPKVTLKDLAQLQSEQPPPARQSVGFVVDTSAFIELKRAATLQKESQKGEFGRFCEPLI